MNGLNYSTKHKHKWTPIGIGSDDLCCGFLIRVTILFGCLSSLTTVSGQIWFTCYDIGFEHKYLFVFGIGGCQWWLFDIVVAIAVVVVVFFFLVGGSGWWLKWWW